MPGRPRARSARLVWMSGSPSQLTPIASRSRSDAERTPRAFSVDVLRYAGQCRPVVRAHAPREDRSAQVVGEVARGGRESSGVRHAPGVQASGRLGIRLPGRVSSTGVQWGDASEISRCSRLVGGLRGQVTGDGCTQA